MRTTFRFGFLSRLVRRARWMKAGGAGPARWSASSIRRLAVLGTLVIVFASLPLSSQPASTVVTEDARDRAMDAIKAKFESLRAVPPPERNRQTAAFMRTLKEVSAAGVSDDGTIWALFTDHVPYQIFASSQPLPPQSGPDRPPKAPTGPAMVPARNSGSVRRVPVQQAEADDSSDEGGGQGAFPLRSGGPREIFHSQAGAADPQLQGNDLPASTQAMVANALGDAFGDITGTIRTLLDANGYTTVPGNDASIETLMKIRDRNLGVFFLEAHGGTGQIHDPVTDKNVDEYILATSSLRSPAQTRAYMAFADPGDARGAAPHNLFLEGYLGLADAVGDRDPNDPTRNLIKRYYTITPRFIRKYWRFADNSFAFIHGCTSILLKETMRAVGVSIYGGYNALTYDPFLESVKFLFDRMLGANTIPPDEELVPQRPFDYQDIAVDMERKGLNQIAVNPKCRILFGLGLGNFGLLNPSIMYARILAYQSRVELVGLFGADPGEKNRKVEIENISVPVESWEPERIVCHLPNSEQGSAGEIKVTHRGRVSNSRWLTQWTGTAAFREFEDTDLHFRADFKLRFVADPWPYRLRAGDKPVQASDMPKLLGEISPADIEHLPTWGVSSMNGSTCSWAASGRKLDYDGRVLVQRSGAGTPPVVTDDVLVPLNGSFEVGGPYDPLAKELWVSFVIVDQFIETPIARGDPREGKRPTRLRAYHDGQSAVRIKVNEDFDLLAGKSPAEDGEDSSGGEATWSAMKATHLMPKNARR